MCLLYIYIYYVCYIYIYILFLFLLHDVALLFHFFFKGLVSLWWVICRAQGPRRGLWLSSPTCRSGIRTSRNGSPWSGRRWATAGTFFLGSGPNIIDPWLIWGTPWFKKPARFHQNSIGYPANRTTTGTGAEGHGQDHRVSRWTSCWLMPKRGVTVYIYFVSLHMYTYVYSIQKHYIHYIHTYIHTYLPTYLHTYIPTYLHTYIPTYLHTYIPTYLHTYIPTYLHTYIPTYLHTYIPTYVHTYIRTYVHTYVRTYIHTYIHMSNKGPKVNSYEIGDKIHLNIFIDLRYNTLQLYTIVR